MFGRKNNTKSGKRRFSLFYGRLTLHPLFLFFGLWHAATGRLLSFFSIVVCAILHELAHASEAAKHGFAAKEIVLMPYGATIDIDLEGVSAKDDIRIALAGPLCNLMIAAGFLALWWCYPTAYPYTESAFYASLSLALCNLLPAFSLDGGRVVYALLYSLFNAYMPPSKAQKTAKKACCILSLALCAVGVFAFAWHAMKGDLNLSLIAFTLFVAVGLFDKKKTSYSKLDFSNRRAFEHGTPVKHIAVAESCTVKKALSFLSSGDYLVLDVYDKDERYVGSLTQTELSDFFQRATLYTPLCEYFW